MVIVSADDPGMASSQNEQDNRRFAGFVNAPALWQLVMAEAADACVDIAAYQEKRDVLCDGLARVGYDVRKPEGGYYVFL